MEKRRTYRAVSILLGWHFFCSLVVAAEPKDTEEFIEAEIIATASAIYPSRQGFKFNTGIVDVMHMVDSSGSTFEPMVLHSTDPSFENASLKAVKKDKYTPATLFGEKVESVGFSRMYYLDRRSEGAVPPKICPVLQVLHKITSRERT